VPVCVVFVFTLSIPLFDLSDNSASPIVGFKLFYCCISLVFLLLLYFSLDLSRTDSYLTPKIGSLPWKKKSSCSVSIVTFNEPTDPYSIPKLVKSTPIHELPQ
jgi:hypothetical protein